MNNKQKIVIAALVVLLLAATAFMLYSLGVFGKKGQKTPSLPSQVEEGERISRLDRTWRLIFETEEQTIDLTRKKEDGKYIWTLTDDENFPISTDKVNSIASAFSGMHSIEKIELKDGAEELKKYGLDQPIAWLTAGDAKENEQRIKLLFGDLTGEKYKGDDLIYVSVEDEPEVVYKVVNNILPQFEEGLYGLAKYADIPTINEGNIEKLSIKGEKSTEFTLKTEVVFSEDADGKKSKSRQTVWYCGETKVERSSIQKLYEQLCQLTLTKMVSFDKECKNYGGYGLNTPSALVVVHYLDLQEQEQQFSLKISQSGSLCYIARDDDGAVYEVKGDAVNEILNIANKGL